MHAMHIDIYICMHVLHPFNEGGEPMQWCMPATNKLAWRCDVYELSDEKGEVECGPYITIQKIKSI